MALSARRCRLVAFVKVWFVSPVVNQLRFCHTHKDYAFALLDFGNYYGRPGLFQMDRGPVRVTIWVLTLLQLFVYSRQAKHFCTKQQP